MIIKNRETSLAQRVLGAVDLAIDFATLGEYGLEPIAPDRGSRRRTAHPSVRESAHPSVRESALLPRRGECPREPAALSVRRARALS